MPTCSARSTRTEVRIILLLAAASGCSAAPDDMADHGGDGSSSEGGTTTEGPDPMASESTDGSASETTTNDPSTSSSSADEESSSGSVPIDPCAAAVIAVPICEYTAPGGDNCIEWRGAYVIETAVQQQQTCEDAGGVFTNPSNCPIDETLDGWCVYDRGGGPDWLEVQFVYSYSELDSYITDYCMGLQQGTWCPSSR